MTDIFSPILPVSGSACSDMAAKKISIVLSQTNSRSPDKKSLEETIAARLMMDDRFEISLVPNLYDMPADHSGLLHLKSLRGNFVILSWLYPRGTHWILDRQGIRGKFGTTLIRHNDEYDDEEEAELEKSQNASVADELRGPRPNRWIYSLDLRDSADPEVYINEIVRIAEEHNSDLVELNSWINGSPKPEQMEQYLNAPEVGLPIAGPESPAPEKPANDSPNGEGPFVISEPAPRRWYPVIDYDRCTNCMECIDFCLFGVYGVDQNDLILVESQDSCKKGCPACSRVCPENAIVFPAHKSPGIAGSDDEVAGLKIDLSKLFGGGDADSLETALAERDRELLADGRQAVGDSVGVKRKETCENRPKDQLDSLMDDLDQLDL